MFIKSVTVLSVVLQSFTIGLPAETLYEHSTPSASTSLSQEIAQEVVLDATQFIGSELQDQKVSASQPVVKADPYVGVDRLARENVGVLVDGVYTISTCVD